MCKEDGMSMGEWERMEDLLDERLRDMESSEEDLPSAESMDEVLGKQMIAYREYRRVVASRNKLALRSRVWITAQGKEIPVAEMSLSHLKNAIRWLRRQEKRSWRTMYCGILEKELEKRGHVDA